MTLSSKRPLLYFFFGLLLIAAAADTYLYLCTAYAPWGFSDSAAYFSAARNLAQGTGLGVVLPQGDFVRLEVFAPFYSIVLSPFAGANLDLIAVSRWMNLILFAGLTIGCGWLFFRVTRSYAAGLLFAILLGTTPALASAYSSMMSEPLACALGFPALLLSMAAARENSMKLLLGAAFLSALALFTRYAFLAVPVAGLLIWVLFGSGGPKQRWLGALGFSLLSFVPTGVWVGIGLLQRQTIGTRVFAFPDSLTREITEMAVVIFNVVKYWLPYRSGMIPGLSAKIASPVLIAFFLGLTLFSLFAPGRKSTVADPSAARLVVLGALIFAAAYLGVLFIAYAFSGMLDLNERTLMPLLPALYLLLLSAALFVERSFRFKVSLPWIQVMIVLFFVGYNLHFLGNYLRNNSAYPKGYASPAWKGQPIFEKIDRLPAGIPLLSNAPDVVLFYTNRNPYYIYNSGTSSGSSVGIDDESALAGLVNQQCGVLILFPAEKAVFYNQRSLPLGDAQLESLRSRYAPVYQGPDGEILTAADCVQP